jgi:hypothetical protein
VKKKNKDRIKELKTKNQKSFGTKNTQRKIPKKFKKKFITLPFSLPKKVKIFKTLPFSPS